MYTEKQVIVFLHQQIIHDNALHARYIHSYASLSVLASQTSEIMHVYILQVPESTIAIAKCQDFRFSSRSQDCYPDQIQAYKTSTQRERRICGERAGGLTCTHLPSYQVSQKSQAIQKSPFLYVHKPKVNTRGS